jgi:S-disulfanyl-L-cysteine oxidoreductase SoxD
MRFAVVVLMLSGLYATVFLDSATSASAFQTSGRSTQDGVYTEAQARRGEAGYSKSCTGCHGPDLTGVDAAPSLTGGEFNAGWNDLTLDDLFDRIRTTMPGDAPGSLSSEQCADILAFILAKDGFAAGPSELVAGPALKNIRFAVPKK